MPTNSISEQLVTILKAGCLFYAVGIITLWAMVCLLTPSPTKTSTLRISFGVAILMTILGNAIALLFYKTIGAWVMLGRVLLDILIVKVGYSLPVWKSIFVAVVYFIVVLAAYYFYVHTFGGLPVGSWEK